VGPQLCQISPGEGASTIEGLVTRDNRRFDAIAEQIQRKGERIQLSKQVGTAGLAFFEKYHFGVLILVAISRIKSL
jgi:hypothetical protein